jgi:hypothetical protein
MNTDKGQFVRLVDVFILGPFMIWFGIQAKNVPELAKNFMVASGVGTILLNGRNYLAQLKSCKICPG